MRRRRAGEIPDDFASRVDTEGACISRKARYIDRGEGPFAEEEPMPPCGVVEVSDNLACLVDPQSIGLGAPGWVDRNEYPVV